MKKYTKVLLPMVYVGVLLFMVMSSMLIIKGVQNYLKEDVTYKYALDGVFDGDIMPVMKTESNSIIRPYLNESVIVGKYFYDYESDDKKQAESIIFYENKMFIVFIVLNVLNAFLLRLFKLTIS